MSTDFSRQEDLTFIAMYLGSSSARWRTSLKQLERLQNKYFDGPIDIITAVKLQFPGLPKTD